MNPPRGSLQLPPPMSTIAPEVDHTYAVIEWLSVLAFTLIVGTMLVHVWRFRRRPGHDAVPTRDGTMLPMIWTFAPLPVLAYLFHRGFQTYAREAVAPVDALEIRVVARQWSWDFVHPDGPPETNELHVPVNRAVKLIMSSTDVLHGIYVPEFRVQRDIVPGMFSTLWFEATHETGDRPILLLCSEYCGAPIGIRAPAERAEGHVIDDQNSNHATMLARLHVLSPAAFDDWLQPHGCIPHRCENGLGPEEVRWGECLYRSSGCSGCHSTLLGSDQPAPSWAGIWGRTRTFEDGTSTIGDEAYIRQSILEPQAHIVAGYTSVRMPAARFSDAQMNAIVAYIRSLEAPPPPARPDPPRTRTRSRARARRAR